jgi:hypothetical protein
MPVNYQIAIDCTDPDPLARFWAAALGYFIAPPPAGYDGWDDHWREMGVPDEELGIGTNESAELDHYAVAMRDPEDNEFDIN